MQSNQMISLSHKNHMRFFFNYTVPKATLEEENKVAREIAIGEVGKQGSSW